MKKILMAAACILLFGCNSNNYASIKGNKYITNDKGLEISLVFDKNSNDFYGQAVNNYFGTYSSEKGSIKFSLGGSTMMAAPEELMNTEATYFKFLSEVDSYTIKENKLILKTNTQSMEFEQTEEE
ncbi:MAG: META domain-containing protein [Alphaproteobacteria bacterium]|nr:META domain-containing protein [Alphaproteobacteria bacterium]